MDNKEYAILAAKTLAGKFYATDLVSQNLLHGAIGLVTEAVELVDAVEKDDEVNIVEECADVLWYLSIYEREMGLGYNYDYYSYPYINLIDPLGLAKLIQKESSYLLDLHKKATFYGKPILQLAEKIIVKVKDIQYLVFILLKHNTTKTIEDARRINIAKLSTRYPDGFSEYFAEHRDLEKELKILQDKK